uniref:BY PROTMAP: gi/472583160/gb/EMS20814.1/ 60S ribosomal protein l7 l12 [Rhodosporidium toruloides NP11] gi/647397383/emb/CDR40359.1/ RHTO0S05e02256g1_1 [Rhodosporidium toruloides] n=1 Tax=Rhodotorula toruloides TaxID=5286 RepID=A0A0K3CKB0_RHOTO
MASLISLASRSIRPARRVVPSAVRALSSSPVHRAQPTAEASSSAAPAPPLNPKIGQIVDQIAGLTLLEAADLVDALKEKTVFNVQLTKIDAAQKAKAIREVKAIMPGMNLVEAKKFVESLPKTLKEGANKEEAEKLQALFKGIGAEVALE